MKLPKTKRREEYKQTLTSLLEREKSAHNVEMRYKVMAFVLSKEWGNLIMGINKESLYPFLQDVIYMDRLIRKYTEGEQEEEKTILSQKFQIEDLPKM